SRPDPDTVATITRVLRGEVHVLEPRKMWPGGAFGPRGKIPPGLSAEPGRIVVYADAPEWREVLQGAFNGSPAPDAVEALRAGAVAALSRWRGSWSARPDVVVPLAAGGYPELTSAVADHVAQVGRLERGELTVDRTGYTDDLSSAEEAKVWRDGLHVDGATSQAIAARTVLLLVDATSSQWPVTVAAAKLREAGAAAVLPLVIHKRP
ncbi:MAG TPA: ATP-dependent DNA helicase RecQ, partial [Kribbella sp.]|nr:ATP-dependent DNA helicase RecQ [Kribbella sp.]